MLSIEEKPLVRAAFLLCKKVQVFVEAYGDAPIRAHFVQSGKTRAVCSYNELRRKIQKPVLLRLRLAASEKPVLNAPASACVADAS